MTTLSLAPAPLAGSGGALPRDLRLAICLITFRRPRSLARLLTALARQAEEPGAPRRVTLVVVDNDPEGSAGPVVEAVRAEFPWPIIPSFEPRRGIPAARNRSVALALAGDADALVFIDDDEEPAAGWLRALVDTQRAHEADVVSGRVQPRFEQPPPSWAVRGGFFQPMHFRTGTVLPSASTSNTLVRRAVFAGGTTPFDEAMALTGGSDTRFFRRCVREGWLIVAGAEAVVFDCLPAARVSVRWVLLRAMRHAMTLAEHTLEQAGGPTLRPRLYLAAKGLYWVVRGLAALPGALLGRPDRAVRAAWWLARGIGVALSLAGVRCHDYRRVHGS